MMTSVFNCMLVNQVSPLLYTFWVVCPEGGLASMLQQPFHHTSVLIQQKARLQEQGVAGTQLGPTQQLGGKESEEVNKGLRRRRSTKDFQENAKANLQYEVHKQCLCIFAVLCHFLHGPNAVLRLYAEVVGTTLIQVKNIPCSVLFLAFFANLGKLIIPGHHVPPYLVSAIQGMRVCDCGLLRKSRARLSQSVKAGVAESLNYRLSEAAGFDGKFQT